MPCKLRVSNLAKAPKVKSAIERTLFLALATFAYGVQALSPSQVFDKVKDSVVVVRILDAKGKTIGQGSGVMLPSGKIGTNCHVVANGTRFQVGGGKQFVSATLWGSDEDKDICLLEAVGLTAKPAQLGQAMRLKVGEPVYAVGAPRGLELSFSDGIVSQLRGGPPPLIQTTAAISPGSSGGGLFDAEGRLVGFTTLYIEGGQSLNFAMPVEWAGEIQPGKKATQGRSEGEWTKRAIALERARNWTSLRDWCQQWTQAQPANHIAWIGLGAAFANLRLHSEAIEAYRQALRINPDDSKSWTSLGAQYTGLQRDNEAIDPLRRALRIDPDDANAWGTLAIAYNGLQRYTEAIDAARQAVRVDPGGDAWLSLGSAYVGLRRLTEAIDPFRQAVRNNPDDPNAWRILASIYGSLKRHAEAITAARQAIRIDPKNANAWATLALSYEGSGNRPAALEALGQLRRINPALADEVSK